MTLRAKLKRWYEGEYVPPDNSPDSGLVFLIGHYQRHWSSRFAHTLVDVYFKEWKWVWGSLIAVGSLIVAIAKVR